MQADLRYDQCAACLLPYYQLLDGDGNVLLIAVQHEMAFSQPFQPCCCDVDDLNTDGPVSGDGGMGSATEGILAATALGQGSQRDQVAYYRLFGTMGITSCFEEVV